MTNQDADGVRYSYFSFNELANWCGEDLFYGPQARDLSYEEALVELKMEAESAHDNWVDLAEIAADETDHGMGESEREKFIERWFEKADVNPDKDDFVQNYVEREAQHTQIDEPIIEGTLDGVSYRISWLGGAPHIFVFKGPLGYGNRLCSPCVPGAVDGGGGFTLESEADPEQDWSHHFGCYCVPRSWLRSPTD